MAETIELYLDHTHHFLEDRLFTVDDGRLNGDRINAPFAFLRDFLAARNIRVRTADYLPPEPTASRKIYISMGMLGRAVDLSTRPDITLSALFAMECPIVDPTLYENLARIEPYFKRIFSWSDSNSLRRFMDASVHLEHFCWPQSFDCVHEDIWERRDRKFLVMINANKLPLVYWQELYTERLRAIEFFSRSGDIDLYGKGWRETPFPMYRPWMPWTFRKLHHAFNLQWHKVRPDPLLTAAANVYRGPTHNKSETLGNYRFALCFENMKLKGWITEKIFDCFFAGTIPVYWGAPNICDYVPADCFIDMRRFDGYDELRTFLKQLNSTEIRRYRHAARAYLSSNDFYPFSKQAFAERIASLIEEDMEECLSVPPRLETIC